MSYRLMHKLREGQQVEPALTSRFAQKFLLPRLGQRKAQLLAANALRLHLETSGPRKITGRDPKLVRFLISRVDLCSYVVVNHGGPDLPGRSQAGAHKHKQQNIGEKFRLHKVAAPIR